MRNFNASDVCIRFRNPDQMSISDIHFGFRFISDSELFGGGIGDIGELFSYRLPLPLPPFSRRRFGHRRGASASGARLRRERLRLQAGTVQARFARSLSRIPCTGLAGRQSCPLSVAFRRLRLLQRRLRLLGAAAQSAATPKNRARNGSLRSPLRLRLRPRHGRWRSLASASPPQRFIPSLSLSLPPTFASAHSVLGVAALRFGGGLRPPHRPGRWGVLSGMTLASLTMPDVLWAPLPLVGWRAPHGAAGWTPLPHARPRWSVAPRPRRDRRGSPSACGLRASLALRPAACARSACPSAYARLRPASPARFACRNRLRRKLPPPAANRNRLRRALTKTQIFMMYQLNERN